jgi:hypothetical protein
MSSCTRCGARFGCAMADGGGEPCWCAALPAVVAVPGAPAGCWCPACLKDHIAGLGLGSDPAGSDPGVAAGHQTTT